jgi:hypothetical protein
MAKSGPGKRLPLSNVSDHEELKEYELASMAASQVAAFKARNSFCTQSQDSIHRAMLSSLPFPFFSIVAGREEGGVSVLRRKRFRKMVGSG